MTSYYVTLKAPFINVWDSYKSFRRKIISIEKGDLSYIVNVKGGSLNVPFGKENDVRITEGSRSESLFLPAVYARMQDADRTSNPPRRIPLDRR